MLLNYLKLAVRLLLRNPFFAIINIVGLAIGFASFFALWQYSSAELKTDQHYKDFERIARIAFNMKWVEGDQNGNLTFGASKASIPPQLLDDFPEMESYVRISEQDGFFQNDLHEGHRSRIVIANKERDIIFKETKLAYADRNIFGFFGIPLLSGDPENVLAGVNFVALSESVAKKYFGGDNPIGETLTLNDSISLKVTGIYSDMMPNSRLHYDMIVSNEGLLTKWSNAYWGGTLNFVKLKGTDFVDFETKLNADKKRYFGHILNNCNNCDVNVIVQPLKEIAFSQGFIADDAFHQKSKPLLIILGSISIIVLIMAWINYVNLSITRLTNRMKEFATRKASGATARDLILQFLIEAAVINILAIGISLTLLQVTRRPLQTYFDIYTTDWASTGGQVWIVLLISMATGILITGLYPAYIFVKRHPQILFVLKANTTQKSFTTTLFTTFQFAAATILILWVFVINLQLNYILHKDTGFKRDGILIVESPVTKQPNYEKQLHSFVNELKNIPAVNNTCYSRFVIGEGGNKPGSLTKIGTDVNTSTECNGVEENFIPFFALKIVAGRNFIMDDRSDAIIISRLTASRFGYTNPADAIGTRVLAETGDWGIKKEAEIIGVIEDYRRYSFFNYSSTNTIVSQEGGLGLFLTYKNTLFPELTADNIAININMNNVHQSIAEIESLFKKSFPGNVLEWRFLEDQINKTYGYEKITRNQIILFTVLAIGIACLGLVAMMSQKIIDKTKEIGIRKILGAKSNQIAKILLQTTFSQFIIAMITGLPIAFYLGNQYLLKYSERIPLSWWYALIPISILISIMLVSVSTMLWKAVRANPVESLRSE